MKRPVLLLPIVLVAACGTPQEQCVARQTRDLRILDRLVVETQGNLDRGFALEKIDVTRDRWVLCQTSLPLPPVDGAPPEPSPPPRPRMCLEDYVETETQPKAIDLRAEADKLAGMKIKRRDLAKAAEPAIAACRAAYPE